MKVYQNNWWNRIFHKEELARQACERIRLKRFLKASYEYSDRLKSSNSLFTLFFLHKEIWFKGFKNKNLGPDECGMFRTKDIITMTPEEVFLGNIYGLWTYNIPEWEKEKEHRFGANSYGIDPSVTVYQLIVEQYRSLLLSNVTAISQEAEKKLDELGWSVDMPV